MIRVIYYIRTFFISVEVLALLLSLAIYLYWEDGLRVVFESKQLNQDALKWLTLVPVSIAVWTLKEARDVIFPDERSAKTLSKWPSYWKLKAHFYVGINFCVLLVMPCILIWFFDELKNFQFAWAFFTFTLALAINAGSFYLAKIQLKSILVRE